MAVKTYKQGKGVMMGLIVDYNIVYWEESKINKREYYKANT